MIVLFVILKGEMIALFSLMRTLEIDILINWAHALAALLAFFLLVLETLMCLIFAAIYASWPTR